MASNDGTQDSADAILEGRAMPTDRKLAMVIQLHKIDAELKTLMELIAFGVQEMGERKLEDKGAVDHVKLLSQVGFMRGMLDEIHHTMGHTLFDQCWSAVEMGHEFDDPPAIAAIIGKLAELFGDDKKPEMN
jgi:hypothetical protein